MSNHKDLIRRVLVIDDNEAIHRDFDKILGSLGPDEHKSELDRLDAELFGDDDPKPAANTEPGFELYHALQGKEGFHKLEELKERGMSVGVAFVDMRMPPGWDGVETIENLWKVDPYLQVVICTAYSDHSWEEISERLGRTDKLLVLKKPFDEIEVIQLATSLCEKRRLLEESLSRLENLENVVGEQAHELKVVHQDSEALIQSITSVIISLDKNGKVNRWNHVAEKLFGFSASDAIGMSFEQLPIRWADAAQVNALVTGIEPDSFEDVHFQTEDRLIKTLDLRVFPILNDWDSMARLIVANDVTRQNALKAQLDQAQRLESVGQLAAGVAHEINTPMQYIGDNVSYVANSLENLQNLLDLLPALVDDKITDEEISQMRQSLWGGAVSVKKVKNSLSSIPDALGDVIDGVSAVTKIVAAMKEFSHPGNNEKMLTDLNHVLESTITVARNEWKYDAEVRSVFAEDLPHVLGFPSELNQAFLNIIVNASHAITDRVRQGEIPRGEIFVTTQKIGGDAVVTIEDTGGGIPEAIRERVFEPFFTTKEIGKGTGQGLSIAHAVVVQKHGGSLTFEVKENVGTKFIIKLPLQGCSDPSMPKLEYQQ